MNTTTFLRKQFANIHAIVLDFAGDITDAEWVSRSAPGQNMLGFTVWHLPRTQDSMVQTWIRGVPEVAHADRWKAWHPSKGLGIGAGFSLDEADGIALSIGRAEVLEYTDAVHQEISTWLKGIQDSDLDQVLDWRQRLAGFPEYQTPGYIEEVTDLYDLPIWGLLMRPCIGHIHRHLGEIETVKKMLRARQ